jgi:hypothetical protein
MNLIEYSRIRNYLKSKIGLKLILTGLVLIACLSTVSQCVGCRVEPKLWVTSGLTRVGRDERPEKFPNSIQLYAARGEYESFQVIIRASRNGLTNVNLEISDLVGPNQSIIPKSSITLYREHYVHIVNSSVQKGFAVKRLPAGWFPDALIPFIDPATGMAPEPAELRAVPYNLPADQNQPFWVDILVPRMAIPGKYQGQFVVTCNQGKFLGEVGLQVWNFELPKQPSFKSAFQFWPQANYFAKEELLRHKIMPLMVDPSEEVNLINKWGLNCTNFGFWSRTNNKSIEMATAPTVKRLSKALSKHSSELFMYNYTADEIDDKKHFFDTLKVWAQNLHQVGVKNLVTMKPVPELFDDGSGYGSSAVDIWVLLPNMYVEAGANVTQALKKGNEIWSYNCLVQDDYSPKWQIDYEPINFRIQPGFISQSLGITGLLYWRVNNWGADPWNHPEFVHGDRYYNGEGVLVYPGEKVGIKGVAPSMRLKWIRDGVEDYEYIQLLKNHGYADWALKIAQRVGANWHHWTRDPQVIESVHKEMGEKLEQIFKINE